MPTVDETRSLYLRLLRAWNTRDAAAMAGCFHDDGIMIGFDGSLVDRRADIQDHLTPIFADHATAAFVTIIRSIREAGSARILLADVGMVPPGTTELAPAVTARQAMVSHETADGELRIALFQNTPAALHMDDAGRQALIEELSAAYLERGPLPD